MLFVAGFFSLGLLMAPNLWACPMCLSNSPNILERYGLSFLLLASMPFLLAGAVGALIFRFSKRP